MLQLLYGQVPSDLRTLFAKTPSEHDWKLPEQEFTTLFRMTSNQIRSLSYCVSSRVSDGYGLRLRKTFVTALNTSGEEINTSVVRRGYDDVPDWFYRVTKALYALRYTYWGL